MEVHHVSDSTYIYHITHINNLSSILECGCLLSTTNLDTKQLKHVNIAHRSIQEIRANTNVPVPPFGVLHDYVPFYFCPRTPMLYTISRGNVEGYAERQSPCLHLVSTVQSVAQNGLSFAFTDGHAIVALSQFYNSIQDLQMLNWDIIRSKYWFDTLQNPDRKRRKQAEFLVYQQLPWDLVLEVGTENEDISREALRIIRGSNSSTRVTTRPKWYY